MAGRRPDLVAGRYFLARCGAQTIGERLDNWQFPLRKPLFAVHCRARGDDESLWQLMLPPAIAPAYRWIRALAAGEIINLIGPLGRSVELEPQTRNLLLVGDMGRILKVAGLADSILDRGGRVSMVVLEQPHSRDRAALLERLPIAAEVQFWQAGEPWPAEAAKLVGWADQIGAALATAELTALAALIRSSRLKDEERFALAFPDADLVCGVGACLACVIQTGTGGVTRACIHGPIVDLNLLAAKT